MDDNAYLLDQATTQHITDIIAQAIPASLFRVAIVDAAMKKGGILAYSGVYITTDYQTRPINLGESIDQLTKILFALYWPIKKQCGRTFNKAHFNLDVSTHKLTYSLSNDPDLEWLQASHPDDHDDRSLTPETLRDIESWAGLPHDHPRPWLQRSNNQQGC